MTAKLSKRIQAIREKVGDRTQARVATDAFELLKACSSVKFDEGVDVSVNLGVDARKSDQVVRGASVLPHGTGRSVRVAVFAQGDNIDAAKNAGADVVGFEDLAESVQKGNLDFDVVIATPDAMRVVGKLGQILGPRGLMPNPKVGTVTTDVAKAVANAKAGQVQFRTDKNGLIHCTIGRLSFTAEQLRDNLQTVLAELKKAKPTAAKGIYIRKITVSSTMGPGIVIDQTSVDV